jgi:hypothetical protein
LNTGPSAMYTWFLNTYTRTKGFSGFGILLYLCILPVLGIRIRNQMRIRRIRMFLGLLDPDPDLFVRGLDPDPSPFLLNVLSGLK